MFSEVFVWVNLYIDIVGLIDLNVVGLKSVLGRIFGWFFDEFLFVKFEVSLIW